LIMPVVSGLLEDSRKKEFVQSTDLIYVHENSSRLLLGDQLPANKRGLIV
jgi:hypothetical protein